MSDYWPQIKARLIEAGDGLSEPQPSDIRAALQRVEEATTVAAQEHDRAEALRQRVDNLEGAHTLGTALIKNIRQRVEELERLNRYNVAQAKADAEAAEAKLAKARELLKTFYSDAYIEEALAAAKEE